VEVVPGNIEEFIDSGAGFSYAPFAFQLLIPSFMDHRLAPLTHGFFSVVASGNDGRCISGPIPDRVDG